MIQKKENFLNEKNIKITKREHALKSFASTHNVEILNCFNLERKLKEIESTIKLKKMLSKLRGFTFLTTLIWVFKKIESKER